MEKLTRFLVRNGISINQKNIRGQTPLAVHLATAQPPNVQVVSILLDHGADWRQPLQNGSSLLHLAVEQNAMDIAQLLIAKGASVLAQDGHGRQVLDLVDKRREVTLLKAILHPPKDPIDPKATLRSD